MATLKALIPMVAVVARCCRAGYRARFFRGHRYPSPWCFISPRPTVIATAAIVMGLKLIGPRRDSAGLLFTVLVQ